MSATQAAISDCPTCGGVGYLAQSGATLACPECGGGGGWISTSTIHRFPLTLPLLAKPNSAAGAAIPYIALGIGGMFLLSGAAELLGNDQAGVLGLLWQRGWAGIAFGVGGLLGAYGLSLQHLRQRSKYSFEELADDKQPDLSNYLSAGLDALWPKLIPVSQRLNQADISEPALLAGLLAEPRIQSMISRLELNPDSVLENLQAMVQPEQAAWRPLLSKQVRERVLQGCRIALEHGYPYADLEDVLLAFLQEPGPWAPLFAKYGLDAQTFQTISDWYAADTQRREQWRFWMARGHSRPKGYMNRAWTALPTRMLDSFGTDLTQLAASGRLPSVSVREAEIQQLLEVLGRSQHNSAVLVGETGVGKTTLLGGVALRMIEGNVPPVLQDKRLVLLEISTLLAQSGSSEQELEMILEEVAQAGNVILAVPDIHLLTGTSGSALDAASLLGSALQRGQIQLISTARYADYHRYVENSPMLANSLELIEVKEASVEQTVRILEAEVPRLEGQHSVTITYPAIRQAAELAKRYLPEKILPTSAINLLDETASAVELEGKHWVTGQLVSERITTKTGVPVGQADAEQTSHLLNLETELHARVVGQDLAVRAVSEAMRRAAAGLHQNNRPLASFLFVGPTGTGKTELAKSLAALHFGREDALIRFDMSEYQEPTAAYQLIGAPAGSSESFTEGGTLTQAIREHPYSLVLFDEVEKAHPDVLNLLLQLLDDGRLTENTGRTVQFSTAVIIATSNAGTAELTQMLQQTSDVEQINRQSLAILQRYFKPELINRFDRIVPFLPLSEPEIEQITRLQLDAISQNLAGQKYEVRFADGVVPMLAAAGFDPVFGARPLRRAIQDKVEGVLATLILTKQLQPGGSIEITPEMIQ